MAKRKVHPTIACGYGRVKSLYFMAKRKVHPTGNTRQVALHTLYFMAKRKVHLSPTGAARHLLVVKGFSILGDLKNISKKV